MKPNALFILLLILFDGVAVAWGVWEYMSARPAKKKPDAPDAPDASP